MSRVLELDKKSLVVVSNKLIDARYRLTISEIRLFVLMIFAFDKVRGEVRMSAKDVASAVGLKGDFYSALKRATQNLMRQIITIEGERGNWEAYNITSKASCIDGVFTIKPNPQIEQHLINLKRCFTKYELAYGLALKSTYGFRLYQFGKKNLGLKRSVVQIDLEEFRKMLGIEKSEYQHIWNFKKKVLDVAQQDVNAITDITVSCRSIKQGLGGKIVKLEFTFSEKKEKPNILSEIATITYTDEEDLEVENKEVVQTKNHESIVHSKKALSAPRVEKKAKQSALKENAQLLFDCGISESVAIELSEQYELSYIQEKITLADTHAEYIKNKAGFLIKALKENWTDENIVREEQNRMRLDAQKALSETRKRLEDIWTRYGNYKGALGLKKYEKLEPEKRDEIKREFLQGLNSVLLKRYREKSTFGYEDPYFRGFFLGKLTLPTFDEFLLLKEITLSEEEREMVEQKFERR